MAWLDIKSALVEMLTGANYTVKNNEKISRDIDSYVVVVSVNEENLDKNNYVGVGHYRNMRSFSVWVYNKIKTSNVDLDLVRENAKDEMETILEDVKTLFGSVYNAAGDAGAIRLQYTGMEFEDIPTEGLYAPVRMSINFECEFIESRHIS